MSTFNPSAFPKSVLKSMLASPAMAPHHQVIKAYLTPAKPAPKAEKPAAVATLHPVDAGKTTLQVSKNGLEAVLYSKGYARIQSRVNDGAVILYKEDAENLIAVLQMAIADGTVRSRAV